MTTKPSCWYNQYILHKGVDMRKSSAIFFCLAILVSFMLCACNKDFQQQYITDDQGRALILHGLNVSGSSKYYPDRVGWTKKDDILRMSGEWGFNFARMLVLWDGLEPEKGVFDETYLDRIAERLDWYQEAGIHVVLDMHQDLYSIHFGGDGAPDWAVEDNGLTYEGQEPWYMNYVDPAVMAAFGNFWDYRNPKYSYLQEHYTMAVMKLVERFKDHPAVIGYDLMNEPFSGYHRPLLFESQVLKPFYERLATAIRTLDNDNWVFFEPMALGCNQGTKSGLGVVNDTRSDGPKLAYFPHLYTIDLDTANKYSGNGWILLWESNRREETKKQDAPMLIGELGVMSTVNGASEYLKEAMAMADRSTSGWAYWSYDAGSMGVINGDGSEQEKINILVRVYPKAIAGYPVSYGYDPGSRTFKLVFRETGVMAPTEIYIPAKRFFPEGWKLAVSDPAGSWSSEWNEASEVLKVNTDPNQTEHTVTITPGT
jgi:endoglycosylceramidase